MMEGKTFDENHFWSNLDKYLTDTHNDDQRLDISDFHLVDMQDDKIATVPDIQADNGHNRQKSANVRSPDTCDFQLANLSDVEMVDISDVQSPNESQTAIVPNYEVNDILNLPINDTHNSETASISDLQIEDTQNDDSSDISIISNDNAKSDCSLHELYSMNEKAQKCLKGCIAHLKNRLNKNLEEQGLCSKRTEKWEMLQHRPYFLFVPYFRDTKGLHPPLNEDTGEKKLHDYVDAYGVTPDLWAEIEVTAFKEIVQENAYNMAAQPMLLKVEFLCEKKKRSYIRPNEAKRIKTEITGLRKKIDELRLKTFEDLWSNENITLDWLLISTKMRNEDFIRSPEACKLMWINYLRPEVNKKEFTPEEDRILKRLALQNEQRNWDRIAELLGTGRTAIQCCERFQGTLNDKLFKNFWTPEEEQKLVETIDFCKIGNFIPWKKVIQFMSGRTLEQLQRRWYYCDRPQNRQGAWTTEEDTILLLAHEFFDNRWRKITDFLGGRSTYRCRERYCNMLDPKLAVSQWAWEEDKLLLTLVALYGEKSELISHNFVGRTPNMINERCGILKQDKPSVYEKVLKSGGRNLDAILPKEQFARCKIREDINNRRKQLRSEAFECAKKAIEQEVGNAFHASTCNTFEELAMKINLPTLKSISSKLIPINLKEVIKCRTPYFRHDVLMVDKMKEETDENSFNSEEEEEEEKKEEVMTVDDIEAMAKEFDHRIFPTSVIASKHNHNQTLKRLNEAEEYAALRAHLLNAFDLGRKCSYDRKVVDDACFDFHEIGNPLFVALPPKDQLPIISVNLTTINSLISILLTRKLMGSWVEPISPDASDMLDKIMNDEEGASKTCSSCKILRLNKVNGTKVNHSVRHNNFNKVCDKCKNMERIAERLQLLLTRFLLTFAFTSLLTKINPSKHQILELKQKDRQFFYQRIQRHLPQKRVLRKRKMLKVEDIYTDDDSDENTTDED